MDNYSRSNPLILEESLEVAQAYLKNFVTKPDFLTEMKRAFGNSFDVELALSLVQSWSKSDFSNLPKIEIRSRDEINGANGAFASATNTVYLSREFLKASSAENIASVLLEEIGHAIDARLNQSDSPGDEGAIFSALVRGKEISLQQLTALKTEDDTATITLDGQVVQLEQARFDGTSGDDFREGTSGSDLFLLGAGNDVAYGDNRNSRYYGDDTIYGEDGNDYLHGEYPSADQSFDHGSNDYVDGGNGDDTLEGDAFYTQGNDTLLGGNGNDFLFGSGNNDVLDGGEGNDFLNGGYNEIAGHNTLLGGIGNDTLFSGVGVDFMNGGEGIDIVDYSWVPYGFGVNVNLDKGTVTEGAGGIDYLADIEIVVGSEFSDTLTGSDGNNTLYGWFGNDILEGGFGDDFLIGDNGSDTAIYVVASNSVTVNLETGIASGGAGTDTLNSIENAIGSKFNDSLIGNTTNNGLDGREGDDYLQSGSGNDVLVGGTGNDTLKGELGDDSLYGLAGNDYLDGGEGNDYLYGESDRDTNDSGNDTLQGGVGKDFLYGWGGDDLLDGGEGDDYLYGEPNSAAQVQSGKDTLLGGAGKDYLYGGDGNDILDGGEGDDQLYGYSVSPVDGSNDNDTLLGGAGKDFLYGDYQSSNGNDYLDGGDGDDYVEGGGGNDTLIGSSGADRLYGDDSAYGKGNDSLNGKDGSDSLYGSYGIDTLSGGADNDYLDGGGDDFNIFNPGTDWVSESADTNFTLTNNQLTGLGIDTLSNIERANLRGGDSNNVLDASGSKFGVVILSGEGGNDTLKGGSGNDILIGVNSSSLNPGFGELDMLVGGTGADRFILGDATWVGYDDRNTATNGTNDYAIIPDFSPIEDIIQLQGPKTNYRLDSSDTNTNLYIDKSGSEPDELIAVIQGVTGLDINSNTFVFIDPIIELAFDSDSYSVNEDGTSAVTITRRGSTTSEVSATINLTNGTATAPADYDDTPIIATLAAGEISKTVNIPIVDDTQFEEDETLNLALTNPTNGATIGSQNTATLTIVDNDVNHPPVAVDDTATTSQNTSLIIPVSTLLSNDTDEDGDTLTLSSVDNATNGSVELGENGTVVFTPATDFLGEASFDYTIADGNNGTDTAQVIVTVNPSQPTEGDDTLYGTPGNDTIDGLGGNDLIFGLADNDSLYGGNDNDTLDGGEGDDYLNPGAGINAVIGGTGVDLLNLDYSDETNNLTINYTDPNNGTISDGSSFSEIEWVIFKSGTGNDTADLSAANYAEFRGNAGNDSFLGGAGNDYLEGGFGSDILIGGEGNDVIEGWGGGDDLSDEGDYIDAGGGNDVVYGDAGNDSILGGAGNDHLDGVGGNDTLLGGDGDDRQIGNLGGLFGGEGDDLLYGEAGNDELWGQAGNDTVDGGEGNDVLNGNQGNDSISGGEGNDIARGGKDDDVVFGDAGNDRLFGDLGNDSLWGGEGRDEIIGGDSDDTLIGGLGGDTLTGGDGNDQFVYRNFSDRTDQIVDFTPSKDLIVLTEVFSNLGYRGANPINDGYMQLVQSGLNTLVQIDPDGAGFATFKTLVTLQNVLPNDLNDNSFQF